MKNQRLVKSLFVAAVLCAVAFTLFVSRTHPLVRESSAQNAQADKRELVQVLRRDGLRGAAKLKGHYVADFDPHWDFGAFDIESLTKNSAAVIVAVAGRNLGGHLTEDGQMILTNFEVIVRENIKGDIIEGSTVIVSLPGGRVQFEDGTTAELRTPTFEHLKTGGSYTFFLGEAENVPGVYTPTGGPQGLVELSDNGSVKSHGRDRDPIAKQAKDMDKQTFLKDVREQAKKWPNKGKCCT